MHDDLVRLAIEEMERGLQRDDARFVERVEALHRAETVVTFTVFLLLTLGAIFLTTGLATASWPAWVAGLVALVASAAVDRHHKRSLGRSP